jgi:hypothetical protein
VSRDGTRWQTSGCDARRSLEILFIQTSFWKLDARFVAQRSPNAKTFWHPFSQMQEAGSLLMFRNICKKQMKNFTSFFSPACIGTND